MSPLQPCPSGTALMSGAAFSGGAAYSVESECRILKEQKLLLFGA